MAAETLKKLWKNEYFQTAIMSILIVAMVFGFWHGIQWTLKTEYPALAVASTSMLPTLNVGDLIIVQGTPPDQIYANNLNGDIIVFRSPSNPDDLIVHRAVNRASGTDGYYYFTTHGDNNPTGSNEGPFHERYLVGKVVGKIPYVGNFALLIHTRENMYLFTILIIILIVILLIFPFDSEREKETLEEKKKQEKRKLFGKLDIKIVYFLVLNALILSFIVFSLCGAFTFWQLGANPPQDVTIHGMYPDVQFHESFNKSYNNIREVFLSQGFLAYTINCFVSDGINEDVRPGVPTLSWAQAAIIVLIMFDVWELTKFLKSRKTVEAGTET